MSAKEAKDMEPTHYEVPKTLTQAEAILLEILKSQLAIEEAAIAALTGSGDPALMKMCYGRYEEIKKQIEGLTKPVLMPYKKY